MNYNEALNYIHSVSWTFCKPGLERISELCKRLGNPQKELKFIHVAGTNGKGSFCSMLHEILKESGYRVGLFTSPYIKEFNERIAINGESISNEDLADVCTQIKPIADSMQDKPTEFELITAIGFEYFKRKKCDFVILECGLGGRLDSTNIVENKLLSVITGIALDHTSILGNTIPQIAKEKAGIIREGIPTLWCGDDSSAKEVIENEAKLKNAPFFVADRSTLNVKKQTLDGSFFDFDSYNDIKINLLGTYQIENATNALNAVKILKDYGLNIPNEAVKTGLEKAKWHARFEIISKSPLIIFDGGHNPQGVCEAVKSIKKYFGNEKLYVVTGIMADKDYNFVAKKISEIADKVFCLSPNNERALDAESYSQIFNYLGTDAVAFSNVNEAVKNAISEAKINNKGIICLGSLYMYGDVINALSTQ